MSNEIRDAVFSPCGEYRYRLTRIWDNLRLPVMVIGLNPSTANADRDDHTIRLLTKVLKHFEFPGFHMMNIYGLITPKPSELIGHPEPMGDNYQWLKETSEGCQDIIFAWGAFKHVDYRVKKIIEMFPDAKCFGHNDNGSPWHPRAIGYIKDWQSKISLKQFRNQSPAGNE